MLRFGTLRNHSSRLEHQRYVKALVGLLIVGFVAGTLYLYPSSAPRPGSGAETPPRAVRGVLDASGWNFSHGNLRLDGEWELYFGQLLDPTDFPGLEAGAAGIPSGSSHGQGYVTVPGSWIPEGSTAGPLPRHGVATYRLLITGVPHRSFDTPWALEIPYARTAYRLWVDDMLVASNGVVSENPEEARPQYKPLVVTLPTGGGLSDDPASPHTLQLVLQIANHHFRSGGIPKSLILGPAEQVNRERQARLMTQMFSMGAIALMAVYFAMTYAWRPAERSILYFSLLSGIMAVRTFVTGELPVVTTFPDFPWELQLRIEYLTSFLGPAAFMLSLHSLFPQDTSAAVKRFWVALGLAGSVMVLVLPIRISSLSIPYYTVLAAALVLYVSYVLLRAAWRKREAAELTLAGGAVFLLTVVLTMFHYNQLWVAFDWVPVGTFALLLSQALALSRRYALAFRREKELAHQNGLLLQETQRQLAERNRLYRLLAHQDEQTRRGIAEMLHGRVQARLFAASQWAGQAAEMAAAHPQQASRLMREVQQLVEQVRTEDVRDASHQLHPAAIRAGLVGALDSLLARRSGEWTVHFSVDGELAALDDSAGRRLKERLRLALYRIAEEALNNIHRHARARQVRISLSLRPAEASSGDAGPVSSQLPDARPRGMRERSLTAGPATAEPAGENAHIELLITDDGVGFDPATNPPGLGLQLIAARAADLGGQWEITSAAGRGTRVRVVVPLELEETASRATHSIP